MAATYASNPYADNPYVASQVKTPASAVEIARASEAPPPTAAQAAAQEVDARTRSVGENELVQSQIMSILNSENPYIKLAQQKAAEQANSRGLLNSSMAAGWGQRAAIESALPIAESDAGAYRQTAADNMSALNAALMRSAELATDTSQFNAGQQNTLTGEHARHRYGLETSAVNSALEMESAQQQHEFGLESKHREQGYKLQEKGVDQGNTLEQMALRQGYTLEELAERHGYDLEKMAAEFGYDLGRAEMEGYQQRLGIKETGKETRETSAQEFRQDYSIEELKGNIASALSYQDAQQDIYALWEKHASETGLNDQKAYYDMASQLRTQVHEKQMEILEAENLDDRERLQAELKGIENTQLHWQTMARTDQEYGLKGDLSAQEAFQQGLLDQGQYDHEMQMQTSRQFHETETKLTEFNNTLALRDVDQMNDLQKLDHQALIDANTRTHEQLLKLDTMDHEFAQKVDFLNRDAEVRAWLAGIEQGFAVDLANIQGNFALAENMQTVAGGVYDATLRSMATVMDNDELSGAAVSQRVSDLMGTMNNSLNWLTTTTGTQGVVSDPTAALALPPAQDTGSPWNPTAAQQRYLSTLKDGPGDGSIEDPVRVSGERGGESADYKRNRLIEAGGVQVGENLFRAPDGTFFEFQGTFDINSFLRDESR